MEQCMGIDVGYGLVKVTDGQEGFVFPSVVGEGQPDVAQRVSLMPVSRVDDLRMAIDGQIHYIGNLAIRHSRLAYRGLSPTRAEGNEFSVLFLAGLSLFCHQPLNSFAVVTGLPPGRMHLADDLIRRVRGEHRVSRPAAHGAEEVTIRVERVAVVPQPLGAYWSQVLDPRGKVKEDTPALAGRTGILDIGFRTSDLVTVTGGEYVPEQSRTIPTGLAAAYDEIAARLFAEHGVEREPYALDEAVIRGEIGVAGRRIAITDLRERALAQLATKLLVELNAAWQIAEYDFLLIAGGGAHFLAPYLLPHLPQAAVAPDPGTANSRGFFSWANRLWNPTGANWSEHRPATA